MSRRRRPRLAHPRVKPEVANQVTRGREASDVTDLRHERRRDDEVHAGDCHQPPDLLRAQRVTGQRALYDRDLAVKKRDLAQATLHGRLLINRQALLVQPRAAALAEQVADGRTLDQVAGQHGMDLVLGARALANELRTTRDPSSLLTRLLVGQPHRIEHPRRQQPRECARVQRVGLRFRVADLPQLLGVRDHDACHVRLEDPRDRKRARPGLKRDVIVRPQALSEQLKLFA